MTRQRIADIRQPGNPVKENPVVQLLAESSAAASTLLILISSALYGNDAFEQPSQYKGIRWRCRPVHFHGNQRLDVPQSIITTTVGVAVPGATQTLAMKFCDTITESSPPGYLLTGVSCTGMGGGGIASLNGNSLTSERSSHCGWCKHRLHVPTRLPTLTLTKVSNGVGAFTFSGTNSWSTQTITTTTRHGRVRRDADAHVTSDRDHHHGDRPRQATCSRRQLHRMGSSGSHR